MRPGRQSEAEVLEGRSRSLLAGLPFDLIMSVTALVSIGADQITKYLVRENLRIGQSWPEDGFFRLTHGTNTGSAFGLFQDQTFILTIASIFAIGFIIYFYRSHGGHTWLSRLTVGLLLGGAFGNLIDRLIAGKVTDFIDVGPWPIFNIADSSIVVGMALLIYSLLIANDQSEESSDSAEGEQAR